MVGRNRSGDHPGGNHDGGIVFSPHSLLAMGWFFFVITLIPVIGVVQVGRQAMADRYAYVPSIGLFIMLAWGLSDLVVATAIPRVVPALAALCLILASAEATTRYLPYWQNGVKLFTRAAVVASHQTLQSKRLLRTPWFPPAGMMRPISTTEKRAACVQVMHSAITIWQKFCLIAINFEMPCSNINSR